MKFGRFLVHLALAAGLSMFSVTAPAATATFDGFAEGFLGDSFVDGGIRFFNPDDYVPGTPSVFAIDRADDNLGGSPFFSAPNGLAIDGFVPGGNGGGSRFGSISMELDNGALGTAARLDLFINLLDAQNRVLLVAFLDGVPVASDSISGPITCCDVHRSLELGGVAFDRLRLFGVGPFEMGAVFMLVDNVSIQAIPLPPAALLLGGALGLLGMRRRRT